MEILFAVYQLPGMKPMIRNSYILHIYDKPVINKLCNETEQMTGIVEAVDTGIKHAFCNKDELWEFMTENEQKILEQV